jgi:hypothetical protein
LSAFSDATSKSFPFTKDGIRDLQLYSTTTILNDMVYSQSLLRTACSFFFLLACAEALKFDIEAKSAGDKSRVRCIRNFVAKDTLVVVTSTVDGYRGDGMRVDMHVSLGERVRRNNLQMLIQTSIQIKDAVGNEYGKPKDVVGEQRMAFTSHADSSFDVCFENHFTGGKNFPAMCQLPWLTVPRQRRWEPIPTCRTRY